MPSLYVSRFCLYAHKKKVCQLCGFNLCAHASTIHTHKKIYTNGNLNQSWFLLYPHHLFTNSHFIKRAMCDTWDKPNIAYCTQCAHFACFRASAVDDDLQYCLYGASLCALSFGSMKTEVEKTTRKLNCAQTDQQPGRYSFYVQ